MPEVAPNDRDSGGRNARNSQRLSQRLRTDLAEPLDELPGQAGNLLEWEFVGNPRVLVPARRVRRIAAWRRRYPSYLQVVSTDDQVQLAIALLEAERNLAGGVERLQRDFRLPQRLEAATRDAPT